MDVIAAVFAVIMLATGAGAGWLLASRRAEMVLRASSAETAALRAALESDRVAASRREELLMRTGDIAGLLRPMSDSLARVGQQLGEVEKGRVSSDVALREQVSAMSRSSELLSTQASQLVAALRTPQVRGRWGEMQLERIVEAAGMTEHVDFETQVSASGNTGTLRPDMVVRLTEGKNVVVDSKVACSAYLEAMEATDEAARDARLKAHAKQLRTHIDALAGKAYWELFTPSPEFVVCFVPADAFLDAALREDPTLLEHAFSHDVVLATPSTLVALLRTIAYSWRQEALALNAKQIHELGRDLYKRLATLGSHFERLGKNLENAVGAYNDAVGSMERMVLVKARQLSDYGVVDSRSAIAEVAPLADANPRRVSAPELLDPRVITLRSPRASSYGPTAAAGSEQASAAATCAKMRVNQQSPRVDG